MINLKKSITDFVDEHLNQCDMGHLDVTIYPGNSSRVLTNRLINDYQIKE